MLKKKRVLWLVFAMSMIGPLAVDLYLPSLPQMGQDFSATHTQIQLTISLFLIFSGVSQLVAGPFSDRFGRRSSALIGCGLYLVGSVIALLTTTLWVVDVARIIQGIGAAFAAVTSLALIRDHCTVEQSSRFNNYIGGMIGLIPTFAPLLGGILALHWGWRATFAVMGTVALPMILGAGYQLRGLAPIHQQEPQSIRNDIGQILCHRGYLFYSLMGMLGMGAIISYVNQAPTIAIATGGLDPIHFALCFGAIGLLQLAGSMLAFRIAKAIGLFNCLRLALLLSGLCGVLLLMLPTSHPLWFFMPVAIGCFGLNMMFGHSVSMAMAPFKHCSGSAAAINGLARLSGAALFAMLLASFGVTSEVAVALSFLAPLLLLPWVGHRATRSSLQSMMTH